MMIYLKIIYLKKSTSYQFHFPGFKKLALTCIATQLNENEIKSLKETFLALDKNGDGTLTLQEVTAGEN
jgi:hypothetical protein